jgi:alkanesulfonate monooxygenase SsuD/methylene tetrahydromethanopterin reductase-like flavin-dependent oxidoreductase (luciferase family)
VINEPGGDVLGTNGNRPESRPPLRFGIVVAQRADWPELARRAQLIEALGFDTLNVVDHFYGSYDIMDPCHEAYTALAGIAAMTSRVRLGVMVGGNTYRNPAFHLKQAVTVDHISGGRVEFGVGAGWLEREHTAYGFDYPSARERVERFAEAIEIWELLQRNERTTFQGTHYQLIDAPFEPKPLQRRLPLLIGTNGPRMMRLAARQADIWNAIGTPDDVRPLNDTFSALCLSEGRDPATVLRSVCPRVDMLASTDDFVAHAAAYLDAGFTDFQIPWPRTDQQYEGMQQAARECLPVIRRDFEPAI